MSGEEQYLIELLNRARAQPTAEATRYEIELNDGLTPGTISADAKQPLAPHPALIVAARAHSQDMRARNFFDHVNPSGQNPGDRIRAAGYTPFSSWGENIAEHASVAPMHAALFLSAPHRTNIMNPGFREIGVGFSPSGFGIFGTENFGSRRGDPFLTGVAFTDQRDGDKFYTIGEGMGDITITARRAGGGTYSTITGPSGGYSLQVPAGTYDVEATGGVFSSPRVFRGVVVGSQNVKLDFSLAFVPPQPDAWEPNDTWEQVMDLGTDDQIRRNLSIHSNADVDRFRWRAPATGKLRVELDLRRDPGGDVDVTIYSADRWYLADASTANEIEVLEIDVTAGATYYLELGGWQGAIHRDFDLVVDGPVRTGPPADAWEPNDTPETARVVAAGTRQITGLTLDLPGDIDSFTWKTVAAGPTTISVQDQGGSRLDVAVYRRTPGGLQLVPSDSQAGRFVATTQAANGEEFLILVQSPTRELVASYVIDLASTLPLQAVPDRSLVRPGEEVTVRVLENDLSPGRAILSSTLAVVQSPTHGLVTVADGIMTYRADIGFVGVDRFRYTVADEFGNVSASTYVEVTVLGDTPTPWQCPGNRYDVNADGTVSPLDVLIIINALNLEGSRQLQAPLLSGRFPQPFYDVNGDNIISPLDVLNVINYLNERV